MITMKNYGIENFGCLRIQAFFLTLKSTLLWYFLNGPALWFLNSSVIEIYYAMLLVFIQTLGQGNNTYHRLTKLK